MTAQAFLVDAQTGETVQRMVGPNAAAFEAMAAQSGLSVVLSDGAEDIANLETYLDAGGAIAIRPRTADPITELAAAKVNKREAIKALRDAAEAAGCMTPLGRMDTDTESQRKVNGSVTMAIIAMQASVPFSLDWTMADNSIVTHNAADMVAAGLAVGTHVSACHARATELKALVTSATSLTELDEIPINEGWPI